MAVIRIKKEDLKKIDAYMALTSPATLVTHEGGDIWKIETPEQDIYYYSLRDLMEDINANLEAIREMVEAGQIERELWEEAWKA